jgi:hypothetical protein
MLTLVSPIYFVAVAYPKDCPKIVDRQYLGNTVSTLHAGVLTNGKSFYIAFGVTKARSPVCHERLMKHSITSCNERELNLAFTFWARDPCNGRLMPISLQERFTQPWTT